MKWLVPAVAAIGGGIAAFVFRNRIEKLSHMAVEHMPKKLSPHSNEPVTPANPLADHVKVPDPGFPTPNP